jgi:hypothetical protein
LEERYGLIDSILSTGRFYNPLIAIRASQQPGWNFTTIQLKNTLAVESAVKDPIEEIKPEEPKSFPLIERTESKNSTNSSQIEINITPPTIRRESILKVLGVGSNPSPLNPLLVRSGRRGSTFSYKRRGSIAASEVSLESRPQKQVAIEDKKIGVSKSTQTEVVTLTLIDPPEIMEGLIYLESTLSSLKKRLVHSSYEASVKIPHFPAPSEKSFCTRKANESCDEIMLSNVRTKEQVGRTIDRISNSWADNGKLVARIKLIEDALLERAQGDGGMIMRVWFGLIEWVLLLFGLVLGLVYRVSKLFESIL